MADIEIKAKDGAVIHALAVGFDDENLKAAVIICHGFGEHSGLYTELAEVLHKAGFLCVTPDQRGHGTPPEGAKNWHGKIPDYQCFIDDIISITEYIKQQRPGLPVALYGHSMGGNIVINTLLKSSRQQVSEYICAVLESPWLSLYKNPGAPLVAVVRLLSKIMPGFRITNKLNSNILTSVPERAEGYVKDPLYHGFLSARMITGIFDACGFAMENAAKLPVKTFLGYADGDVVVCNKAIKAFAQAAGGIVALKEYKSMHAIHNDAGREQLFADVISFIEGNI